MSLENNEDRNCGCNNMNNDCNDNNNNNNCCPCNDEERRNLIKQIKCYSFAVTDLALYLDTHPDDTKAICLHNKYCKELKDLKDAYQKVYGPLSYYYPCNKWRWLEEPWPWEGGNY